MMKCFILFIVLCICYSSTFAMRYSDTKVTQAVWIDRACDAIKNNHTDRFMQSLSSIESVQERNDLLRKAIVEKPRFLELMKAGLRAGIERNLKKDGQTLTAFLIKNGTEDQLKLFLEYNPDDEEQTVSPRKSNKNLVLSRQPSRSVQKDLESSGIVKKH